MKKNKHTNKLIKIIFYRFEILHMKNKQGLFQNISIDHETTSIHSTFHVCLLELSNQ